jgi:hypothetical protein
MFGEEVAAQQWKLGDWSSSNGSAARFYIADERNPKS